MHTIKTQLLCGPSQVYILFIIFMLRFTKIVCIIQRAYLFQRMNYDYKR